MLNVFTSKGANLNKGFAAYLQPYALTKIRWLFMTVSIMLVGTALLPTQTFAYYKPTPSFNSFFASTIILPTSKTVCQGNIVSFGTITIRENDKNDFWTGTDKLILSFGAGFTLIDDGIVANLTNPAGSTVSAAINGNNVEITYTFSSGSLNQFNDLTITGLKVQAETNAPTGTTPLKVTGGHSLLNISPGATLANIIVDETPAAPTVIYGPQTLFVGESATFIVPPVAGNIQYEWDIPAGLSGSSFTDENFVTLTADNATNTASLRVKATRKNNLTTCVGDYSVGLDITIKEKGLEVNPQTTAICNDGKSQTLPDIILSEKFFTDFGEGNGTLRLKLSNESFQFEAGHTPQVVFTNQTNQPVINVNTGDKTLDITYDFSSDAATITNSLIISGVKILVADAANNIATLKPFSFTSTHFSGITTSTTLATISQIARPAAPTQFTQKTSTFCTNDPVTFAVALVSGASYEWNLPAGVSIIGNTDENLVTLVAADNAAGENLNLSVRVLKDGCSSDWWTETVTIYRTPGKPATPASSDNTTELCVGTEGLFYTSSVGGDNYAYVWEFPDNLTTVDDLDDQDAVISTSQNFIRLKAAKASDANEDISVQVRVKGIRTGCSDGAFSETLSITIKAQKQLTIDNIATGDVFSTTDTPITLTAHETGGTGASDGTFSGPGVSNGEFNPSKAGTGNKTITYTYDPGNGCVSSVSVSVLISEPSGIPGVSSSYCKGDAGTVINFDITQLQDISGANPSIIARYIVGLHPINGLGGNGPQFTNYTCSDLVQNIPDASAKLSYTFTPSGADLGEVKIEAYMVTVYNNTLSKDINSISLINGTSCGVSPLTLATININSNPAPVIAAATAQACADNVTKYKYSVPAVAGSSYLWEVDPAKGTIAGSNTDREVEIIWHATGSNDLKITETGKDLCKGTQTIPVVVDALPVIQTSGSTSVCAGAEETYTVTGNATNYVWTVANNKGVIVGSNTGASVVVKWANESDEVWVTASNLNGCEVIGKIPVTVDALSATGLKGLNQVCVNATGIAYNITPTSSTNISWTVTEGIIQETGTTTASGLETIHVDWGTEQGTVAVAVQKTGSTCTGQGNITVNMNSLPVPDVKLSALYCESAISTTLETTVNGKSVAPGNGNFILTTKADQATPLTGFIEAATGKLDLKTLIATHGIQEYALSFQFTNSKKCTGISTPRFFEITEKLVAAFTFKNPEATYCFGQDDIVLEPNLANGYFTITKVDPSGQINLGYEIELPINTTTISTTSLDGTGKYKVVYHIKSGDCEADSPKDFFDINKVAVVAEFDNSLTSKHCVRDGASIPLKALVNNGAVNQITEDKRYFEIKKEGSGKDFEILRAGGVLSNELNPARPLPSDPVLGADATTRDWNSFAGNYIIKYTYTNSSLCTTTAIVDTVTLSPLPVPTFNDLDAAYCVNLDNVQLKPLVNGTAPANPNKGQFIITRESASPKETIPVFNNKFSPNQLRQGNYSIVYTYTSDAGCKETSATQHFEIRINPQIDFGFGSSTTKKYCEDASIVTLTPDQPGGFFTITKNDGSKPPVMLSAGDVTANIADLGGIGMYTINYTITLDGCTGTSQNKTFEIVALPKLSIGGINSDGYCVKEASLVTLIPEVASVENTKPLDNDNHFQIKRISGTKGASSDFIDLTLPDLTTFTKVFDPSRPMPNESAIDANATTEAWNEIVGEYIIKYIYKDMYGCENSVEKTVTINRLPKLSFTGLNSAYCDDKELVTLIPFDGESRITSSVTFKYRRVTDSVFHVFTQGNSFSPRQLEKTLGAGEYEIVLESNASGCNNASNRDSTVTVVIKPTPKNIRIVASRDYDKNELHFSTVADNINDGWTWHWDFRDGTSRQERNPVKVLSDASPQIINYTFTPTTNQGCNASVSKAFKLDFDFEGHCMGGATRFTNKSELPGDEIGQILWNFGDGGTSNELNPTYSYKAAGTYKVTLMIMTKDNIATYELNRRIDIFPVIQVTPSQIYSEGFEQGTQGWISHGVVDVDQTKTDSSSWKLKQPDGFLIRNTEGNAWITDNRDNLNRTDTSVNYNSNEQSYVESPCFDISQLNKPMISFRYWSDTDYGADGVALLYTVDDGKTWQRLGSENLGIDWYNAKPILGAPGNASSTITTNANPDSQGWSGKSLIEKQQWRFARYSLTEVLATMKQTGATSKMVRFRMSFGSNGDNPPNANFDGFAFDDVVIGNRNRMVLLEYFINENVTNAANFDLQARNFSAATGSSQEIISIHHHTAFPGNDVFNSQNDKDPSARAFHQGIREVPRGIIDGYQRDTLLGPWAQEHFADRTLIISPFNIDITQSATVGKTLNVSASVTATLPFDRPVVMHVVVIDSAATGSKNEVFYNITKKMLPDAAGTYRGTTWAAGETQNLDFSWDFGDLESKGFKVVVFVEDYQSKEVHQAGVSGVSSQRTSENESEHQVTGITNVTHHLPETGAISLFPNPTVNQVTITLENNHQVSANAQWQILSVTGKLVQRGNWLTGKQSLSVDVSQLAQGMYIFRLSDKDKMVQLRFEKN